MISFRVEILQKRTRRPPTKEQQQQQQETNVEKKQEADAEAEEEEEDKESEWEDIGRTFTREEDALRFCQETEDNYVALQLFYRKFQMALDLDLFQAVLLNVTDKQRLLILEHSETFQSVGPFSFLVRTTKQESSSYPSYLSEPSDTEENEHHDASSEEEEEEEVEQQEVDKEEKEKD
jgi:hypothetical protein